MEKISKKLIAERAEILAESVLGGNEDPIKAFILLKSEHVALGDALKNPDVQNAVLAEVEKYPPRERWKMGVKFGTGSTGSTYDFSEVEEWVKISDEISELSDKKKKLETSLKAQYESGVKFASMENGGEVDVKKIDTGKVTLKISFPNE